MKENMDMFIRKEIKQEEIKVPESLFRRINMTLENLPEKETEKREAHTKNRFRYAAAITAVFCLLISGTVYATANYVQQRMLSMDENEKKEMVAYTRKSVKDIDTYSRELTVDEKERMETLLYDYRLQGKFPENSMEIVDNKEMITEGILAFITEDSMFVLPERTLTDEELLQIIDFYYKRDYSLMTDKEDRPSETLIVDDSVEETVIEQIKNVIGTLYQVETDNLEAAVEADINGVYRIEISDSGRAVFRALYDSERIVELEYVSNNDAISEKIKPDNKYFTEIGEGLAKTIKKLDSSIVIEEIYCDYNITEDGVLTRGAVNYIFELKNGECYVVKYNLTEEVAADWFIVPYQEYQQTINDNAAKQAERGIQRIRISIDPE